MLAQQDVTKEILIYFDPVNVDLDLALGTIDSTGA